MAKKKYESYAEYYKNHKIQVKEYYHKYKVAKKEKQMLMHARARAKKRGLEFNIEESDIIIPQFCPILGIELKRDNTMPQWNSPSLDRLDSTKGYVKGNIWVISWRANMMKNDASKEELLKFAYGIINIFGKF